MLGIISDIAIYSEDINKGSVKKLCSVYSRNLLSYIKAVVLKYFILRLFSPLKPTEEPEQRLPTWVFQSVLYLLLPGGTVVKNPALQYK